jgi:membrane protein required for colicin V production
MPFTLLDGLLLVIMLLSGVLAMIRGFVREVLSIAAWIAAAVAAYVFYDDVLPFVQQHISNEHIALAVSAGAVFMLTLLIASFVTMRISDYVLDSRIGALDRTLGFAFGALRGLVLVVVAMLFFNWFMQDADDQPRWIADSRAKPLIDALGEQLMAVLPEDPEEEILRQFRNPTTEGPVPDAAPATPGAAGAAPTVDPIYAPNDQQGIDQLIDSTEVSR